MKFGISVIGYRRPQHLESVLKSLDLQGYNNTNTHVWIDGLAHAGEFESSVNKCRDLQDNYPGMCWHLHNGRLGIEKLMLDILEYMTENYTDFLILEDDCFPLKSAVDEFKYELNNIQDDVYSIYGSLFRVPNETLGSTFSRFQGWGWATTSQKCRLLLPRLLRCFSMSENEYLKFVQGKLISNKSIIKKLDITPGRDVVKVLHKQFSWDSCTALLSADMNLLHKVPMRQLIVNSGLSPNSGHFRKDTEFFRKSPFNMVTIDEVWNVF